MAEAIGELLDQINILWKNAESELMRLNPLEDSELEFQYENQTWYLGWINNRIAVIDPWSQNYRNLLEAGAKSRIVCTNHYQELKKLVDASSKKSVQEILEATAILKRGLESNA